MPHKSNGITKNRRHSNKEIKCGKKEAQQTRQNNNT